MIIGEYYKYKAYGLNIESQMYIIGFKKAEFEIADVFIRKSKVPEKLDIVINKGPLFESNEYEFLLHLKNIGSFYVNNGIEIIVQCAPGTEESDISTFISGPCFGSILYQRGLLPLHASSVLFRNKGILIAGISGTGKTTLTTALIKQGGKLIADDISCIFPNRAQPQILPSFPSVKIWKDSLLYLDLYNSNLKPVRDSLQKYYLQMDDFHDYPAALNYILILSSQNKVKIEIEEIFGVEKFRLIKRNAYFFKGIEGTKHMQNSFSLIANLTSCVPVFVIHRPSIEIETKKLISAIETKLCLG